MNREDLHELRKSMIWGAVFAVLGVVVFGYLGGIPFGLVMAVPIFTFSSQMFWGEFLPEFFFFFLKVFRAPGLIFELDLDGILWFIFVKLAFAVIGFILSAVLLLIAFIKESKESSNGANDSI